MRSYVNHINVKTWAKTGLTLVMLLAPGTPRDRFAQCIKGE